MKKKNYIAFAIAAMLAMGVKPADTPASQAAGPESTVSIEFEAGDANVGPLDPDEPKDPGNGGTGESGSLALNHVSHFYFEKQEILTHIAEYYTTTLKPFIQVTDARGTGEGWTVSARASKFTTELGKESLFGATITLKDSSCISPTQELPAPQPKAQVTLKFSGSGLEEIVSAKADTGMGTWLTRWYTVPKNNVNESVVLTVPAGSGMEGNNTAKITWILSSGPA